MYKQIGFVLLSLIYIVNANSNNYQYSNCKRFENKIYQLTVTFPDLKPLNAALRFLPNGAFDELFSVGDGNNGDQVGANFSLSNRIGYYKCLDKYAVRLTGLGYLYKTAGVPFLADSGAVVIHDYYFYFTNYDKSLTGSVKFAVFKSGTNPFTTVDKPVFEGNVGKVTGELLRFRRYYDLSD